MPDFGELLRLGIKVAERAPAGVRLIVGAEKALKKDPDGLMYLVGDGWKDGIEAVAGEHYRRGAEAAMPSFIRGAQDFLDYVSGNVIEGTAVEVDEWVDFLRHFLLIKYGIILIFGSRQNGKTTLAYKLAYELRKRTGFRCAIVNTYPKDKVPVPKWMTRMPMERLIARMRKLGRWLNEVEASEIDDGITDSDLHRSGKKKLDDALNHKVTDSEIEKLQNWIIIIEEASAIFSALSAAGQTASRESAKMLDNQSGHIRNIVIVVCQRISEMPDNLQADAIKFYKWANPDVIKDDRKDGKVKIIRETWTRVLEILKGAREHPKWPLYPDMRSWCAVQAANVGNANHGYEGLMPFEPLTKEQYEHDPLEPKHVKPNPGASDGP